MFTTFSLYPFPIYFLDFFIGDTTLPIFDRISYNGDGVNGVFGANTEVSSHSLSFFFFVFPSFLGAALGFLARHPVHVFKR